MALKERVIGSLMGLLSVFVLTVAMGSEGMAQQLICDPSWTAEYKCMQHCGPCPSSGGGGGSGDGGFTPQQQMMLNGFQQMMPFLQQGIHDSLYGNPADQAAAQAAAARAAAEAARKQAEAKAAAEKRAAQIKSELQGSLGGIDSSSSAGNDLKLLTNDQLFDDRSSDNMSQQLLGGTGTNFFGSGGNGCATPSQDPSVVDLCGIGDPNASKTDDASLAPDPNAGPPQASIRVPDSQPGAPVINGLIATANGLNWDSEKKKRLAAALTSLDLPKDFVPPSDDVEGTWAAVKTRGADLELARQASLAPGPELFSVGAGLQKNGTDCTIFALANAAGLPYGVVASRAGELLKQANWRSADDRAHPEQAIYERGGLNGGEVIFLAEAFGQARVVTPGDFAKTVQGGQPVMINKDGHEMVLAKTFQHDGQTWYEVMDSYQGPVKRLYMSTPELDTVISENGVAYSPNPGTTAKLLR